MKKEIISRIHTIQYQWYVEESYIKSETEINDMSKEEFDKYQQIIDDLDQYALNEVYHNCLNDIYTGFTYGKLSYEIDYVEYTGEWEVKEDF